MEAVKSRSESPFSKSKTKTQVADTSENGDSVIDQIKRKKKSRNKSKLQSNGKDTPDLASNGSDYFEEDKATTNETDNVDSNNGEDENGINNGESMENGDGQEEFPEEEEMEGKDALVSVCDSSEGKIVNDSNGEAVDIGVTEEIKNTGAVEIEDESTEQFANSETESGAKKDNLMPCDSLPESEVVCESSEGTCNEGANDLANGETNLTHEQESAEECSEVKESSQISVNGSDGSSHYEETTEAHIQASPDTATKDENSISNKITNFLGKWSYSQEQKPDSDVSSSKKVEENTLSHPYLSKVSGRRGIRDRLNSSATVFSSKETELKTPDNAGKISLDDSFRVRTNPPRLQCSDIAENPTLRKFKGKRCLNASDEAEGERDAYGSSVKRMKLEKSQESGLLGGILWSPFKKRTLENEDQMKLATAESKLSRLLSPFWFWKKTAAGQKGK